MRLVSFVYDGRRSYGVMDGDSVFAVSKAFRTRYPDLRAALASAGTDEIQAAVELHALSVAD
ncbi:MAG: hypothetical protein AAF660_05775 [Pseudomonadota bacterium]